VYLHLKPGYCYGNCKCWPYFPPHRECMWCFSKTGRNIDLKCLDMLLGSDTGFMDTGIAELIGSNNHAYYCYEYYKGFRFEPRLEHTPPWLKFCCCLQWLQMNDGTILLAEWGTDWLTDWLLNGCWPSRLQWYLIPSSMWRMDISCCLSALGAFRTQLLLLRVKDFDVIKPQRPWTY
jgi:hypothetical protein